VHFFETVYCVYWQDVMLTDDESASLVWPVELTAAALSNTGSCSCAAGTKRRYTKQILLYNSSYPRESEGICFYRHWFVCLYVCLSVCL